MQLSALRTRVRSLTNIRSSSMLPDAEIDTALNDFTKQVWDAYAWPQANGEDPRTLVAGVTTIPWPVAARSITALYYAQDPTAAPVRLVPQSADSGVLSGPNPTQVCAYSQNPSARTITLDGEPAGGETLSIRYKAETPYLTLATDVPPFGEEFHSLFAYGAAANILREKSGKEAKAQEFQGRAERAIGQLRRLYLADTDQATAPTVGRWGV